MKKFNAKTRAEEIAAKIAEAEAEKQAYEDAIERANQHAGRARVEAMEKLYGFFDIDAARRGDVDESKRSKRLLEAFEAYVAEHEELRRKVAESQTQMATSDLSAQRNGAPVPASH